jgi:hypothetical protein
VAAAAAAVPAAASNTKPKAALTSKDAACEEVAAPGMQASTELLPQCTLASIPAAHELESAAILPDQCAKCQSNWIF